MNAPLSDEGMLRYAGLASGDTIMPVVGRKAIRALLAEVARLKACVRAHHDQRGDNRCHLDDLKLYHDALGVGDAPYVCALPPDADMEESCRRYIRQRRCPGPEGVLPLPGDMTIQQLTDEVERLQAVNAGLLEACRECLSVVDDAYEATGFFRVAKTSEQRLKIEAAIAEATQENR